MTDANGDQLSTMQRAITEIRGLKARVRDLERYEEPVAIVGAGVRLPGGIHDLDGYWDLLVNGRSAIGEIPSDRWAVDELYDPDPDASGHMTVRHGGFLDDPAGFDADFFGISPREAAQLDPQQRILLEVAWEALEHGGIRVGDLFGRDVGVYVGMTNNDYGRMLLSDREAIDVHTATGNLASVAAGRLAYFLGTEGPAVVIDTACSSSLVAVHLAAQALRRSECSMAIAGGVGMILSPELTINFSQARMMAQDGRCKTFDAAADGYVRSEGCGLVVLKRLSDAEADGDDVLAVVRGSAVNQDGRSGGLTAPNGPAQERVIAAALADARITPREVSYVEAHGTGTPLGDPIEVGALGRALCVGRTPDDALIVGSMKTNLGHLEAAAGIASLIKVVLMIRNGVVAPHLHLERLNPHIESLELPIVIPRAAQPWTAPADGSSRIAGVSSFGISGTNAHLVVAEPASRRPHHVDGVQRPFHLLTWSANDRAALAALAGRYAALLDTRPDLRWRDVASAANLTRTPLRERASLVAADRVAAIAALRAFEHAGDRIDDATGAGVVVAREALVRPEVTFVMTGHGSQYQGMGATLYERETVFREAIDRCDVLLHTQLDRSLTDILFGSEGLLDDMRYAQPGLFALQYALCALWQSWGVEPDVVAGHSAGEYVAAVVSGVLDLEDGLTLIATRGRLMSTLPADGAMVAVFLDEDTVRSAIGPDARLGIAAVNGPLTTVVSGDGEGVEALIDRLGLEAGDYRRLEVSVAAHSPHVDPILDDFERAVRGVNLNEPTIELVSSMTGAAVSTELTDVTYWRRHLRSPVRFADVFDTLRERGRRVFIEIGPHPTLIGLGRRCWPDDSAVWAASMVRDTDESASMLTALGTVVTAGVEVDWRAVEGPSTPRVPLPLYPWQHRRHWAASAQPDHWRNRGGAVAMPAWPLITAAAKRAAERGPLDLRVETYSDRWDLLDRLAMAYITATVAELGVFDDGSAVRSADDVVAGGTVTQSYRDLLGRWFEHLADDGVLVRRPGGFSAPNGVVGPTPTEIVALTDGADLIGIEPLLDYLHRCGSQLVSVLAGRESALATLFPDGAYDTVDFLYRDWAVTRYVNGIAREAVAAAATPGRPLRIIEVGAGTGGTSGAVLPTLPRDRTEYLFTDVSDYFLARARERFADHPFVRYALFDIERDPAEQGVVPAGDGGGFDIVIASNVLHATRDLDATLQHVRSLLAPGGCLIAYEATDHPRWFDVTTGLIEGWQLFSDDWRGDHPLLEAHRWTLALTAAGFDDVLTLPTSEQPTAILGQHLLLARAPGEERDRASAARAAGPHAEADIVAERGIHAAAFDVPDRCEIDALLGAALDDERHDIFVDVVRRAVAHVLRSSDPDRLPRDRPLLDLGFDSLMAVELRNVLRTCFALDTQLPATLVFDHPNIAAIARFVEASSTPAGARELRPARVSAFVPATTVEQLAEMTDDEVEALLLERLDGRMEGTDS